jgi:hypothetical protein
MRLLTRDALDGRTTAAKMFNHLAAAIENDLGGRSASAGRSVLRREHRDECH